MTLINSYEKIGFGFLGHVSIYDARPDGFIIAPTVKWCNARVASPDVPIAAYLFPIFPFIFTFAIERARDRSWLAIMNSYWDSLLKAEKPS